MFGIRSWNNSKGVLFKIGLNKTLFRTKHAHETASAQKDLGRLDSQSNVLTHSCKVLFFLSTTLFCYGVRGTENSCLIPFLLQKSENNSFSNSPP